MPQVAIAHYYLVRNESPEVVTVGLESSIQRLKGGQTIVFGKNLRPYHSLLVSAALIPIA